MRLLLSLFLLLPLCANAQEPPYHKPPSATPPFYRVRIEGSDGPNSLRFSVHYTIWIPEKVNTLRGIIVHQHGCGTGSCRSGQTGAYDLHWQALARKHDCALLSPTYEQPEGANCQLWCDPRNGSDLVFRRSLRELGEKCGHPELTKVPWALWGHSGGGHWAGGMVMLHPKRIVAAWLRSGVPLLAANPDRPDLKPYELSLAALRVPIMCNLGTKEGVTVKDGRFARVWPANQTFFEALRSKGGLIGIAIDPLSSHDCGNQRYLAIPWLDACLSARLPKKSSRVPLPMPTERAWVGNHLTQEALPAKAEAAPLKASWLPNEAIALDWMHYVRDTAVPDETPPPAPTDVKLVDHRTLTWKAQADFESGLAQFIIERDGKEIARVPKKPVNRFGRPLFQGLQYSDTPLAPLAQMQFTDLSADPSKKHDYRVIAVNTMGLRSK